MMQKQKHKYLPTPNSLFEKDNTDKDQCDGDENSFRPRYPHQPTSTPSIEEQQRIQRQRDIEQRTLESSSRSIRMLLEAEDIGISTAEELHQQREALQNTHDKLDGMVPRLQSSQKHLNGIKSVFYNFKKFITGKSENSLKENHESSIETDYSNSKLNKSLDKITEKDKFNTHPSTRLRGLQQRVSSEHVSENKSVDDKLNADLDEMSQIIARLKGLGVALGEEIHEQNELIDTMIDKVEVVDGEISSQNKQINKLLGNI